jgi:hypothetical protein
LLGFMITYEPEHKRIERKKVERIFRNKKWQNRNTSEHGHEGMK